MDKDDEGLLLTEDRAKEVVRVMGLEQEESKELTRAVTQAGARLEQGKRKIEEVREEKLAGERKEKKD